jgi:FHS family glucose/mannose:H+ symporter-like MFS transporter
MIRNIKALTLSAYLSMLFLGVATVIIGASARSINLSAFEIGLLLAFQNLGLMVGVMVSGALADNHQKTRILMVGSLVLAFSFFTFYLWGSFWLNLAIMVLIGVGVGSYEGVTDAMLLDLHDRRQSLHININHFFVTFGSILLTVYLIFLDINWRRSLVQSAVLVLTLALFFGLARVKRESAAANPYLQRIRILSQDRTVIALFLATALVVGVELGTLGILTTYLMDLRDFSQTTSKIGLLVFLLGIAVGRVVVGIISRSEWISQLLLLLFGLATIVFAGLFYLNIGGWTYSVIFAAGLSISALLPLMITLAGQIYPDMTGTVIGSIKVGIPVGGILIPLIMSLLARQSSLHLSLIIFPLSLFLAFSILFMQFRQVRSLESPPA